jgi:hypothetical protein
MHRNPAEAQEISEYLISLYCIAIFAKNA